MSASRSDSTTADPPSAEFLAAIQAYEESLEKGTPIDLSELCQQFPTVAEQIKQYLADREAICGKRKFKLCDTDRYQIIGYFQQGGMGAIAQAVDRLFDRIVVLKVPLVETATDRELLQRMDQEALLSGKLQHPNILPIFEKGEISTTTGQKIPFFAMRYLEGKSLDTLLNDRLNPLEDHLQYLLYFQQICKAVAYAHSVNVVNRDLKPNNVMIGNYDDAYVIDWGYAKDLSDSGLTESEVASKVCSISENATPESQRVLYPQTSRQPDAINHEDNRLIHFSKKLGTPGYEPPEILLEQAVSEKCKDVFCLGGILCKILTGQPTFATQRAWQKAQTGDLNETYARIQACGASQELKDIAFRCLSPHAKQRPVDGAEVESLITRYIVSQEAAKLKAERRLRNLAVSVGLLGLVLTFSIFQWRQCINTDNRRQSNYQSGMRLLAAGNLTEAAEQFQAGIDQGGTSATFAIKRLRATLSKNERHESLQEVERLLLLATIPHDRAELLLVRGDLKSCDLKYRKEFQRDLESALSTGLLSQADASYAYALLATDITECERHLAQARKSEPLHHRACLLHPNVLVAMGRMSEAQHAAELLQLVFPEELHLQAVVDSCIALRSSTPTTNHLPYAFTQVLSSFLNGFNDGYVRQSRHAIPHVDSVNLSLVAKRASAFIRSLPKVTTRPGLSRPIFEARANFWFNLSNILENISDPVDKLGILRTLFVNHEALIQKLEQIADEDSDAMVLQLAAVARVVHTAYHYFEWKERAPAKLATALSVIERMQTRCLANETIVPRNQFEVIARLLRFAVTRQLSRAYKDGSERHDSVIQADLDAILAALPKFSSSTGVVCPVILDLYAEDDETNPSIQRSEDISDRLRVANYWIEHEPASVHARLHRAKIWTVLGRKLEAIEDLKAAIDLSPDHPEVREAAKQLTE